MKGMQKLFHMSEHLTQVSQQTSTNRFKKTPSQTPTLPHTNSNIEWHVL